MYEKCAARAKFFFGCLDLLFYAVLIADAV